MKDCSPRGLLASLVALGTIAACNDVPVVSIELDQVKVDVPALGVQPVKVDFLWVIDDSTSMCQEQVQLAEDFDTFIGSIEQSVQVLDYRLAVVTTDMVSEGWTGRFRREPVESFGTVCRQQEKRVCATSGTLDPGLQALCDQGAPCGCEGLGGTFECGGTSNPVLAVNCNTVGGIPTFNTRCERVCAANADCDANQECLADHCVPRPATNGCASADQIDSDLGAGGYMTADTAQHFPCVATVGTRPGSAVQVEQGLNAAIWSLAPDGPNAEQAAAFSRPDAYLVVIFVSDEDDCSVQGCGPDADGIWRCPVDVNTAATCSCLNDSSSGGPLRPVTEAANRLKALKRDPGKVLVATIVGDSLAADPGVAETERVEFVGARCGACENGESAHSGNAGNYICHSSSGQAEYGARYLQLAQAFGLNGVSANICAGDLEAPLGLIADRVATAVNRICLPRPVSDPSAVRVTLRVGDETRLVPSGDAPGTESFRLEADPDCGGPVVIFNDRLPAGARVSVDYLAAPAVPLAPSE